MAKGTKKSLLDRLTPNAQVVVVDGNELRVPSDRAENAVMNTVLAAQVRSLIQEMLKRYKDGEIPMTPKELNDLAAAAKNVASFSNEVYVNLPELPKTQEVLAQADEPDFSKIGKPIDVKTEEIKPNEEDSP